MSDIIIPLIRRKIFKNREDFVRYCERYFKSSHKYHNFEDSICLICWEITKRISVFNTNLTLPNEDNRSHQYRYILENVMTQYGHQLLLIYLKTSISEKYTEEEIRQMVNVGCPVV